MAEANIASRRGAEELIERGRVRVNGQVATLGDKADPETDVIEVDGERLKFDAQKKIYFALYKPRNVLTTTGNPHRGDERRTVMDFVPYHGHLFTIGRLDADSEGLVVLTNDGELTNKLTHPRFRHTKTYKVTVYGLPSEDVLARWEEGIWLEDEGKTAPCSVSIVKGGQKESILRIVMTEGKKRQIRRVAIALGHPVISLVRTHIGQLSVEGLRPGEWRELTPQDVKALSTPSPALKDIGARKRRRRDEGEARARGRYGDETRGADRPRRDYGEDRPRQRSLVNETPEERSERRPRRDFDDSKTEGKRPPRRFEDRADRERPRHDREASAFGDRTRRRFDEGERGEERPRRSRRDFEAGRAEGDRPRYPRRDSEDHRAEGERPQREFSGDRKESDRSRRAKGDYGDRPSHSRYEDSPRGEDRPRRPKREFEGDRREDERKARRSFDRSPSDEDRPRRSRAQSGEDKREGDRPRTGRKPFGSRSNGGQRRSTGRPGGSRPRRDDERSGRRTGGTGRGSPSQGRRRSSRSGRDEE